MALTSIQKRFAMFLGGCIPVRIFASWLSYYLARRNSTTGLKILAGLAIFPLIGWAVILAFGLRKTGAETQGAPIWWNFMRPIHMILYVIFIYLALSNKEKKEKSAWIPLLLDALLGLIAFLWYHTNQGNISKVF
jgi:hypothetical protein